MSEWVDVAPVKDLLQTLSARRKKESGARNRESGITTQAPGIKNPAEP